jgi:hypothetical protein
MPVDFDAVRRKMAQLSGQNKSRDAFWKPEMDVTYTVRILPFKDNEGQPFKERYFYYGIGKNPGLLTPNQFGKPDPIQELISKLREEKTTESMEMAKRLYPKMRAYAPIVVRGEEEKGPKLWSFGKGVYQQLLNIILDEDYGDITDVESGRDIKVVVSKPQGAKFAETSITVRPKQSPASEDAKVITKWIDTIPDIDAVYQLKSYSELEKIINEWVASGGEEDVSDSDGTSRGKVEAAETEASVVAEAKVDDKKGKKKSRSVEEAFSDIISEE